MSSTDERRPLLPPPTTGQGAPAPGPERDTHDADEELPTDAAPSAPVARKLSLWVVLIYTVLTLAIIAGVAVIIKGFIDADDVEVCVCTLDVLPGCGGGSFDSCPVRLEEGFEAGPWGRS
jgi:hypothetical protein